MPVDFSAKSVQYSLRERVDFRALEWLRVLDLQDLKKYWKGNVSETTAFLKELQDYVKFASKRNVDGVSETMRTYFPSSMGYGRMNSSGAQSMWGPIKAVLFQGSTDADMCKAALTTIVWLIGEYPIPNYTCHGLLQVMADVNGSLDTLAFEKGMCRREAKKYLNTLLFKFMGKKMAFGSSDSMKLMKRVRDDACVIQKHFATMSEFSWLLDLCKKKNPENSTGSMLSILTQIVETALTNAVKDYNLEHGMNVSCTTHDGMLVDGEKATWEKQDDEWVMTWHDAALLKSYEEVCEAVCPGIKMKWAFKRLDTETYVNDKPTGVLFEVPDDFVMRCEAPEKPPESERPLEKPDYETLFKETQTFCFQVGTNFVNLRCTDKVGTIPLFDENHLRVWFRSWSSFEQVEVTEYDSTKKKRVVVDWDWKETPFFDDWLKDSRRNARFLPAELKHQATMYDFFGIYPDASKCPPRGYNTWFPFAAETMTPEHTPEIADRVTHVLTHFYNGCGRIKGSYNFAIDLIAHSLIYPTEKPGVMMCLNGGKGTGKTTCWQTIERLVGAGKTFETCNPAKDCFGDNNGAMISSYWTRITEADRKTFAASLGTLKSHITDKTIRIRELYCKACNVPSIHRFFADSNNPDSFPDEDGERRFFIVWWQSVRLADKAYYTDLYDNHINNDSVIEALYRVLIKRPVPRVINANDIYVGQFQQQVKDNNRTLVDRFVMRLIEQVPFTSKTAFLSLTADEINTNFLEWQLDGREFDRSKSSVLKELNLCQVPGIDKPCRDFSSGKSQTRYRFDVALLRKRYRLDVDYANWQNAQKNPTGPLDTAFQSMNDEIDIKTYVYEALGLQSDEMRAAEEQRQEKLSAETTKRMAEALQTQETVQQTKKRELEVMAATHASQLKAPKRHKRMTVWEEHLAEKAKSNV